MTPLAERFCEEYILDLDPGAAYTRAGFKATGKAAISAASRLLTNVDVIARVRELKNKRSERMEITADWLLREMVDTMQKCKDPEPVMEWNPATKQKEPTGLFTFDSNGANKAAEMIGRHIGFFEKDNTQGERHSLVAVLKVIEATEKQIIQEAEVLPGRRSLVDHDV